MAETMTSRGGLAVVCLLLALAAPAAGAARAGDGGVSEAASTPAAPAAQPETGNARGGGARATAETTRDGSGQAGTGEPAPRAARGTTAEPATDSRAAAGSREVAENRAMMDKAGSGAETGVQATDPAICAPDGIAVGGYDLVTYREPGGPQAGSPSIHADYDGLRYLFVSEDNRRLFESEPRRYLPGYGGWCAVTLALGRLTCPDYRNFRIENGELLLFEVTGFTNGRTLWETDVDGFRARADANYARLFGGE